MSGKQGKGRGRRRSKSRSRSGKGEKQQEVNHSLSNKPEFEVGYMKPGGKPCIPKISRLTANLQSKDDKEKLKIPLLSNFKMSFFSESTSKKACIKNGGTFVMASNW